MVEPTSISGPPVQRSRAGEQSGPVEPGFDLALAAAGLERQAAAALDVHGAVPEGGLAAGQSAPPSSAGRNASPDRAGAGPAQDRPDARARAPETRETAAASARDGEAATTGPAPRGFPPAGPPRAGAAPVPAAPSAPAPGPPPPAQNTASTQTAPAREASPAKEQTARAARTGAGDGAASPRAASAPEQDFARLLARRLGDATAFELRLDPPALGRVEGRMVVADDGKMVLSLTFDTAAAFDLFRDDEAALRAALAEAGFNLAGGDIAFSLKDDGGAQDAQTRPAAPPRTKGDRAAPLTDATDDIGPPAAGAVDIRI